jgi:hypothetical protein
VTSAIIAATGNLIAALIYPIAIAVMTIIIGGLFIRESRHVRIWDEVGGETAELRQVTGETGTVDAGAGAGARAAPS